MKKPFLHYGFDIKADHFECKCKIDHSVTDRPIIELKLDDKDKTPWSCLIDLHQLTGFIMFLREVANHIDDDGQAFAEEF